MSTMISEVYDALKEAGASEEKARKAAETSAGYENRFASVELKLERLDGTLRLHSWMLGYLIALVTALFFKIMLA